MKDMKLIMENWRKFEKLLTEQPGDEVQDAIGITGGEVLKMPLAQFVSSLQSNKKEVVAAVLSGLKDKNLQDDQINIEPGTVAVGALRPTQNEVVFDGSIPFALKRPNVFMEYFKSDGPFKVGPAGNDAIITLGGKYVLDGHHRWSSLFCVNPRASMHTFNITAPVKPINMLKLMQASIKAYAGQVPSNKGGGVNLFTIDPKTLAAEVRKLITPELAEEYMKLGLLDDMQEDVATGREQRSTRAVYRKLLGIYSRNVKLMQSKNRPVSGAGSRESMPQTDDPKGSKVSAGGETPAALQPLEKGQVDFRSPFAGGKK